MRALERLAVAAALLVALMAVAPSASADCTGASPAWTTTPDYASVFACVVGASPGDTIQVSAGDGSEDWAETLELTEGITLLGPGASELVIRNVNPSADAYLITYDPADYDADPSFRLSGFTLDANGHMTLRLGSCKDAPFTPPTKTRVDHDVFANSGTPSDLKAQAIFNYMSLYGVVDNNTFQDNAYPVASHSGAAIDDWWGEGPQSEFAHGSEKYLYFEDNTFSGIEIVTDGEFSCRYAFRYNTISVGMEAQIFDVHGYQPGGGMDSCFGAEVYGNEVVSNGNPIYGFLYQRSGQVLSFMNSSDLQLRHQAYIGSTADPCPTTSPDLKNIHNSFLWNNRQHLTGAYFTLTATGDDTLTSSTIGFVDSNPDTITDSQAELAASGIEGALQVTGSASNDGWYDLDAVSANTMTLAPTEALTAEVAGANVTLSGGMACGSHTDIPRSGRDVVTNETSPGVTCGSELPASCDVGAGHWVPDDPAACADLTGYVGDAHTKQIGGALYRCEAAGSWVEHYHPYAYPHPLRGEEPMGGGGGTGASGAAAGAGGDGASGAMGGAPAADSDEDEGCACSLPRGGRRELPWGLTLVVAACARRRHERKSRA